MKTLLSSLRTASAAFRMLLLFTVVLGIGYPLLITGVALIPGFKSGANASGLTLDGKVVGNPLLGQNFTDDKGNPLPQYFQSRPSAAGTTGYDPTASSASNLGPESIVDQPDKPSLLTLACSRSLAIGQLDGVDGSRPFCTSDGVGAVLAVFWSGPGYAGHITKVVSVNQTGTPFIGEYKGVPVQPAVAGQDYSAGQLVPIRGNAPDHPAVPADAVTASGSGLDPEISPAYAKIQIALVAKTRGITDAQVQALVAKYTAGRNLGFIGEPVVNVLRLNVALDRLYPVK